MWMRAACAIGNACGWCVRGRDGESDSDSFGDLVALRTLKRLTENRIPARRVRRAVALIEQQFGEAPLPLQALHFWNKAATCS